MSTRCKLICTSVTKQEGWAKPGSFLYSSKFRAVGGDQNPENKAFFEATPNATVELLTVREDHFQVGQAYYVDFTPAPATT